MSSEAKRDGEPRPIAGFLYRDGEAIAIAVGEGIHFKEGDRFVGFGAGGGGGKLPEPEQ
jgi:hypothetical protein